MLDGTGGIAAGQRNDLLGTDASAAIFGAAPHVFYLDAQLGVLRHAWFTGAGWASETLDGQTSPYAGHSPDSVGAYTAVALFGGQPHVFYRDSQVFSLRHGWWDGASWHFEAIDGNGSSYAGHTGNSVGVHTSALLFGGLPHLFYNDSTAGRLRHAWWTGATWAFEILDGTGSTVDGHRNDLTGDFSSAALVDGLPHVFSFDSQLGVLRHAWWNGLVWTDETVDGQTSPYAGHSPDTVGYYTAVVVFGGQPQVFYWDPQAGPQRHAWYG